MGEYEHKVRQLSEAIATSTEDQICRTMGMEPFFPYTRFELQAGAVNENGGWVLAADEDALWKEHRLDATFFLVIGRDLYGEPHVISQSPREGDARFVLAALNEKRERYEAAEAARLKVSSQG